jgi:hypothetical protein
MRFAATKSEEKTTAKRHQWILLRSASYGGTGYELIPLFASICVDSRLENPHKKTRIATSIVQRSRKKNTEFGWGCGQVFARDFFLGRIADLRKTEASHWRKNQFTRRPDYVTVNLL